MTRILISILLLISISCKEEKVTIPPGVISPDSMEAFLYDLHLLEAKILQSGLRQDSASALYIHLEENTMKKFGLDSAKLNKNLKYYTENIQRLDTIYQRLSIRTIKH